MWHNSVIFGASSVAAFFAVQSVMSEREVTITESFIYGVVAIAGVVAAVIATIAWLDKRVNEKVQQHERYERQSWEDRVKAHELWATQADKEIAYLRTRVNSLYDAITKAKLVQGISHTDNEES